MKQVNGRLALATLTLLLPKNPSLTIYLAEGQPFGLLHTPLHVDGKKVTLPDLFAFFFSTTADWIDVTLDIDEDSYVQVKSANFYEAPSQEPLSLETK